MRAVSCYRKKLYQTPQKLELITIITTKDSHNLQCRKIWHWIKRKKCIFKYKILRQIYCPIKEESVWRRKQNTEVGELVGEPDKVGVIWAGHILRKREENIQNSLGKWARRKEAHTETKSKVERRGPHRYANTNGTGRNRWTLATERGGGGLLVRLGTSLGTNGLDSY